MNSINKNLYRCKSKTFGKHNSTIKHQLSQINNTVLHHDGLYTIRNRRKHFTWVSKFMLASSREWNYFEIEEEIAMVFWIMILSVPDAATSKDMNSCIKSRYVLDGITKSNLFLNQNMFWHFLGSDSFRTSVPLSLTALSFKITTCIRGMQTLSRKKR